MFLIIFNKIKNKNEFFIKSLYNNLPRTQINSTNIPLIKDIFNKKVLYINDSLITPEYVNLIKKYNYQNESLDSLQNNKDIFINTSILKEKDKIIWMNFYHLCKLGHLIEPINNISINNPLISIILASFNKEKTIMPSVRSIQNQSFKNIEIIIVDDCSTDQSKKIYNILQKNDSRIRIFYHLKNLGVWRSRLDGFLYSRAKYIIFFDAGDFYADNFILEDSFNLMTKYNLDSLRFAFKMVRNIDKNNISNIRDFKFKETNKIILGYKTYNVRWYTHGTIWNRMFRKNVLFKSFELIDSYIFNAYKNLWEDRWWNTLANIKSYRNLFINRIGYIYIKESKGEGTLKLKNKTEKDKCLQEFIYFWLFDLQLLSKTNNKKSIIKQLRIYSNKNNIISKEKINLFYLTNFKIYKHLLKSLINDPYIWKSDKKFIKKLLNYIK